MKNTALVLILIFATVNAKAKVSVVSKTLKEATHFELSGLDEWRYDVSRGQNTVEVQIQGANPEEIQKLVGFKDKRVSKVVVTEGVNNSALVKFYLAEKMSFFDYQTDSPALLVFDIYSTEPKPKQLSKKVTVKEFVAKKEKSKRSIASMDSPNGKVQLGYQPPLLSKESNKDEEKKYNILDLADKNYKRFFLEDSEINPLGVLKSEREIQLKFPELINSVTPTIADLDSNKVEYKLEPEQNEENQMVRLMFRLYDDKNYAVALKTLKFFREKYPKSKHDETLHLFNADIYYQLWKRDGKTIDFETATSNFKEHIIRYPQSLYKDKLSYLVGVAYYNNAQHVEALNHFLSVVKEGPSSPYYWPIKMHIANCYRALKQEEFALNVLSEIENNHEPLAAQAKYSRGDVYFKVGRFSDAQKEYNDALKKYPKNTKEAANAIYNSAEINFRNKEYKTALNDFRNFLQKYPEHDYASFAMGRIAGLLEILGAKQERVLKANLETYYRYKGTPASYVSKVKINTMRAAAMKPKEVAQVIQEINAELPKDKIEDIQEYAKFNIADIYTSRKEYDAAFDIYTRFYKENINSPYLPLVKEKIFSVMTSKMNDWLNSKKEMEAIQYYLKNKDFWLKDNKRADTDYILGASFEKIHLFDDASKFYESALKKINSLNSQDEKRRQLFEYPVSTDSMNLRLAKSYYKQDDVKKAATHLELIKNEMGLTNAEQVEFNIVRAAVSEKEAKYDVALMQLKKLTDAWKGQPELLLEPYLRISKIYDLQKNTVEASVWSKKLVSLIQESKADLPEHLVKESLKYAADLEVKNGDSQRAISIYKYLIEKFAGTSTPLASAKYSLGKIYFDQNDVKGAEQVWAQLKAEKDASLWIKMAEENLAQMKWSEKLKRYVRKPAGDQK